MINSFLLTIKWRGMDEKVSDTITIINNVFALIFTIEAFIKIMGLGKLYFEDNWNRFDLTIVFATILSTVLS